VAPKKKFIGAEHVREESLTMGVEVLKTDKTLFVAPMNDEAGENPQPIQCRTISEVFDTFRPKAEISVEAEDGSTSDDEIRFERVADFLPDSVIAQSPTLKAIQTELVVLKDLLNQLRNNKTLRRAVDSPQEREILVKGMQHARAALGAKES
jgi:predicted component of type VI protein secretion system